MSSNIALTDHSDPPAPVGPNAGAGSRSGRLRLAFCALVLSLALFQFSENTADPDLWGHIVFGQQMLQTGSVTRTEIYSWTAHGQPWVNHECLAELALGGAHALLGGPGVLLLKVAVGLLTFIMCLRLAIAELSWPARFVAWAFGAVAVVEISYGFAARPQIFTALALPLELILLRAVHRRKWWCALAFPPLFALWINTHGGVLAGFGLLGLAAGMTTAQTIWEKLIARGATGVEAAQGTGSPIALALWVSVLASAGALLCNPWKGELLRWLIASVRWLRPEIEEWNPTPLSWDHGALFALVALSAFSWAFSRRRKLWWELAAGAAFTLLAFRSVRNAPLCAIVLLALVPAHLADVLTRFRDHFERLETLGRSPRFQEIASRFCGSAVLVVLVATLKLHKEHPLTMEAPRRQYPVAAVQFMRTNQLRGNLLVFFDWGELAIFHLPDCPPSIDGRLDTCYSRDLIAAHWKFYNGEPFDEKLLDPEAADLALLPATLAGTEQLATRPGWKPVYTDALAVVLARDPSRFPKLQGRTLPVSGPADAALGRAALADRSPRWHAR